MTIPRAQGGSRLRAGLCIHTSLARLHWYVRYPFPVSVTEKQSKHLSPNLSGDVKPVFGGRLALGGKASERVVPP
jgi:hypothetical protein